MNGDYCLDVIYDLVGRSWSDVNTFRENNQNDLIEMMDGNLIDLSTTVDYLRDSLKDVELHLKVDELKQAREIENDIVPFGYIDDGSDMIEQYEREENDKHQQWATWGDEPDY